MEGLTPNTGPASPAACSAWRLMLCQSFAVGIISRLHELLHVMICVALPALGWLE